MYYLVSNDWIHKILWKWSFVIKNDDVLDKYHEILEKIKETLSIKFHNTPIFDEKYIKAKVREFNGVIKTNFSGGKISKENMHLHCLCNYWFCYEMEKKSYPQILLGECKYRMKKTKMIKFIEAELESELESDIELKLKSELESDTE